MATTVPQPTAAQSPSTQARARSSVHGVFCATATCRRSWATISGASIGCRLRGAAGRGRSRAGCQTASQVLCHCHFQPEEVRGARPTAIIVHGLEGSSDSQYVIGNGNKLWNAGANIIRMNMRNCGGTEKLTPTLYHSGLSGDVEAVVRHFIAQERLQHVSVVGYSMGGNLVLKLAGELGADAPRR